VRRKVKKESKSPWGKGSKRSEKFWLLIGARTSLFFSAQSQSSNNRSRFAFPYTKYTYPPVASHKLTEGLLEEGGIGIFGFAVLAIFSIGFSVFGPKDFGFSVLVFTAVCGFFVS